MGERLLIAYRDSEKTGTGRLFQLYCFAMLRHASPRIFMPSSLCNFCSGYLVSGQLDSTDLTGFKDAFHARLKTTFLCLCKLGHILC